MHMSRYNFLFRKDKESDVSFLISYSDTDVSESDFLYQETSGIYTIANIISKCPVGTEFFIYSDELTEASCRTTLERLQHCDKTLFSKSYFSRMSEEAANEFLKSLIPYYEQTLAAVHFFPFSACPEKDYQERINVLFADINIRKKNNPFAAYFSPFHGSRRLYDEAIISFLKA